MEVGAWSGVGDVEDCSDVQEARVMATKSVAMTTAGCAIMRCVPVWGFIAATEWRLSSHADSVPTVTIPVAR